MAYYRGDYYRRNARGDYYRGRAAGDPFWGALWTGIKAVGGALLGVRPTGVSQQQSAAASGGLSAVRTVLQQPQTAIGFTRVPQIGEQTRTARPPFTSEQMPDVQLPGGGRRRRQMNPANVKALRRSIRRVVGFGRLASRSKKSIAKAATALGINKGRSKSWPARKR